MKFALLALAALSLAYALPAQAGRSVADTDACVQAAIAHTYAEMPVGQALTKSFYEWLSSDQAVWQTFSNIVNKGVEADTAEEVDAKFVAHYITRDYADDSAKQAELLAKISGKRLLGVSFDFGDSELQRYYVASPAADGTCSVEHVDAKIDDYDNG